MENYQLPTDVIMGFLRYSLVVTLVAVAINRIPKWFQKDVQVPPVTGFVKPGWERVRETYQKLFADGDDRGSSLGVYHEGKLVVDLRGGFADERELWPWQENTLTRIFSASKGIGAICVALLVDRGLMDYKAPVTKYWPEFGANGKQDVTVEMLLSHQAGLLLIRSESYDLWDEVNDMEKLQRILAEEKPMWQPGTGVGYHAVTIGLYMDQLIRHADPKHRGIQQFFKEEIAEPFDLDISFGLPDKEAYRFASIQQITWQLKYLLLPYVRDILYSFMIAPNDPDIGNIFPKMTEQWTDPNFGPVSYRNRVDVRKLWNPSVFGYANGRSLAKIYGILANGGLHNGKTLLSAETMEQQTTILKTGRDKLMKLDTMYGRGYRIFISPKNTTLFGTPGLGGQMGYADPANKVAIGFATNYHTFMGSRDLRYRTLEKTIYECIDRIEH